MDYCLSGSSVYGILPGENAGVGLPLPSPGDLPNPGVKPRSLALQVDSLPSEPLGKLVCRNTIYFYALTFCPESL